MKPEAVSLVTTGPCPNYLLHPEVQKTPGTEATRNSLLRKGLRLWGQGL